MPDHPAQAPVQVVIAAFKDMDSASNVLAELKQARRNGLIDLEDAAVIIKGADSKSKIRETDDMGMGKGAFIGALIGAILSLVARPLGWTALGGGIIGSIATQMKDGGFPQDHLTQMAGGLVPGSSVLVVVAEERWVELLLSEIENHDAKIIEAEIGEEIAQQLAATSDALYTVATTGDAIFFSRSSGGAFGTKDELVMHDNSYANDPDIPKS